MFALTLTILATLAVPFCLLAFGVLTTIRATEDDELIDRLGRGERLLDPHDDECAQLLAAWCAECDAPTEPALAPSEARP